MKASLRSKLRSVLDGDDVGEYTFRKCGLRSREIVPVKHETVREALARFNWARRYYKLQQLICSIKEMAS